MSKSLGNFFTIRDVLAKYSPAALRLMLLGTQYRAPINYTQRALEEASDRAYYTYQTLADADAAVAAASEADRAAAPPAPPAAGAKGEPSIAAEAAAAAAALPGHVMAGLRDDLNTPQAVAALSAPLKLLNDLLTTKKGKKAPGRVPAMRELTAAIRDALELLVRADTAWEAAAPARRAGFGVPETCEAMRAADVCFAFCLSRRFPRRASPTAASPRGSSRRCAPRRLPALGSPRRRWRRPSRLARRRARPGTTPRATACGRSWPPRGSGCRTARRWRGGRLCRRRCWRALRSLERGGARACTAAAGGCCDEEERYFAAGFRRARLASGDRGGDA